MIAIRILSDNETKIEYQTMAVLLASEAEDCPTCKRVWQNFASLPQRCPDCDRLRDDRWLFRLRVRAKALVLYGGMAAETGESGALPA